MRRIVRLTEQDLARIVRRVIKEEEQKDGTHSAMYYLAKELIPYKFEKENNATTTLGPNGEFNGLGKGDDINGAYIYYSSNNMNISLTVSVDGVLKVNKKYPITEPGNFVDHKQILKDLGNYKTYNFKTTTYRG